MINTYAALFLLHAERLIAYHARWARHAAQGCRDRACRRHIARECGLGGAPTAPMARA